MDTGALLNKRGEAGFIRQLHVAPLFLKLWIVNERFESTKPAEILQPTVTDGVRDQLRQSGIAKRDEAARRNAIGHVPEFLRPQLGEIPHYGLLEQFGVKLRDAVYLVAANCGEIRHAHVPWSAFIYERESRYLGVVSGKFRAHVVKKSAIDFVNDLQVARQ